ncbi:hypothetical protein [Petroclostridium sp. X23]|uniref:glycan biosynthesis hexose transferase WsfD n=1 Tax=Petroclostridium sp. X23 TaxID=3045146 RepID=UPI0024ACF7A7|nr:hypothetical protein [Petroclostridium sp. X23]WHH58616.1 hypothetical protein QKW49_22940 [Petroclostridium sp. X23]
MYRIMKPSIFAVLILFLISGYALFISPLIGLADNGDFGRIMVPNGLKHEQQRDSNDYFGYFNHKYDRLQYYNGVEGTAKSTHSIIIKIAMGLDDIFTDDGKFDIRFIAFISLAVLALSIYWMIEVVEGMVEHKSFKYLMALVAVIIFGDIGYTAYFNSFFGEGVAYPFYLLSISSLLKFSLGGDIRKRYLFIYFISSFIFMGSKSQFSLNGIFSFALLTSVLYFKIPNKEKVLSVILASLLLGSSILMYFMIDDRIYLINKYHMITRGVMLFEPDVQAVTKEAGIDEQFALLSETIYFDRTPVIHPEDEILLKNFYSRYNIFSVTIYYLKNPSAFSKIMEFAWKNSYTIRPEVLGNYERDSGKEYGERTNFFGLWSYLKENHIPHSSNFAYFFFVICLALAINKVVEYRNKGAVRTVFYSEIVMLYVFLTGFSQVLISFIAAGDTDLKKHLFMTTVSLDILFYYYFAYAISMIYKSRNTERLIKKELL